MYWVWFRDVGWNSKLTLHSLARCKFVSVSLSLIVYSPACENAVVHPGRDGGRVPAEAVVFLSSPVFIVYSFICESRNYTFNTFSFTFAWSGDEGNCEWGALQEHDDNQQDRDHQELLFPLKKVKGLSLAFYPILLPSIALSRGCCPVISHLLNKEEVTAYLCPKR